MDLTKEIFCKNLKTLRKKAGMKQSDAAEAVDVDLRTYQRWEQGSTSPSDDKKMEIALAFKATVSDLYRENLEAPPIASNKAELLTTLYTIAPQLSEKDLQEIVRAAQIKIKS